MPDSCVNTQLCIYFTIEYDYVSCIGQQLTSNNNFIPDVVWELSHFCNLFIFQYGLLFLCRFFFTYLLPHSAPSSLRPLLDKIVNATGNHTEWVNAKYFFFSVCVTRGI